MSGHPREQLSALLDGELGPAEQAELQAHLAACPQCAAELQELALVGQAARELDEPPPEGYFDALPGRVRQRLRAARTASVAPAAARRGLVPAWSWAAAAAVLVGVLLPVLWQRQAQAPLPAAAPATASAPQQQADAAPKGEQAAGAPAFQARSPYEAEAKTSTTAPRREAEEKARALPAAPPPSTPAPEPVRPSRSAPGFAPAPAAARPAPAARSEGERELAAPADGLEESVVVADAAQPAAGGAAAPEPRRQAEQDELRKDEAAPQAAAASAESRKKAGLGRAPAENQQPAPGKQKGDAFGDLTARRPATAAEARELAREWQRQAELQATPALADEARLRGLEALAAAWRLSGHAADRAALERAVAAYAARPDAAQKRRAEALLPRE